MWLLGGEIIRDVNEEPALIMKGGRRTTRPQRDADRLSATAGKISNALPPAANSTASSLNPIIEPARLPMDSPDEPNY